MQPSASSSSTYTYTVPPPEPATSYLVVDMEQGSPKARLQGLLDKMQMACERLPVEKKEQALQAIVEWKHTIFQDFQLDSPLSIERDKIAYALCFFYVHRVEYIILNDADAPEEQVVWLELGDDLMLILSDFLPEGRSADEFLEMYRHRDSQRGYTQELEKVSSLFDRLEEDLYRRANELNGMFMASFESLKGELLHIINEQRLSAQEVHEKLDSVTEKVTQLYQSVDASLKGVQAVFAQIEEQGKVTDRQLQEAQQLLDEVNE